MTHSSHYDVIIVGGGPAGSACASVLSTNGLKVLVCEKAKFPRDKICGDCLNPHTWGLLNTLGAHDMIGRCAHNEITGVRVVSQDGTPAFTQISRKDGNPFVAVKRSVFDAELLRHASKRGAEVLEGTPVQAISWNGTWEVTVTGRTAGGPSIDVTCDVLIGADGRNSVVRRILQEGMDTPKGASIQGSGRIGIQWHTDALPLLGNSVELYLFDSGYCGMVNVNERQANIAMVTTNDVAGLATQNFAQFLSRTLFRNRGAAERFARLEPIGPVRTAFPIDPRRFDIKHPKAFLIGDARETVEPFTGEGMYFAMQDGIITASAILQNQFHKDLPPAIDRRYRFWVNRVYSPILRNPVIAGAIVRFGAKLPRLTRIATGPVF